MDIGDFLSPEAVACDWRFECKRTLLQALSARAATLTRLSEATIADSLLERERIGNTGMGDGIALPHGKLPGLTRVVGVFARLAKPVPYDAPDGVPVDLAFLLLAPEADGSGCLKALSRVSRLMRKTTLTERLRRIESPSVLYRLLTSEDSLPARAA